MYTECTFNKHVGDDKSMDETKELNLEEFFENLQNLNEVTNLIKAEKENTKTNVFNIFSVLRLETKELIHSKFIAELLNPKGSHGMGSIFLDNSGCIRRSPCRADGCPRRGPPRGGSP